MASKDDYLKLFEILPEKAKQSAYDYLLFLSKRYPPDAEPLTEERIRAIKKAYREELQEFQKKHGSLEALTKKEDKTDKDRADLDDWMFYLDQLKNLG